MIVYHASNHKFKVPDYTISIKNTTKGPNHINGLLGCWVALGSNYTWIESFGKYIYEIELEDSHVCEIISCDRFGELSRTGNEEDHIDWRNALLRDNVDVLSICEYDGIIHQSIIINYDIIKACKIIQHS